jgi:hypothetical protein
MPPLMPKLLTPMLSYAACSMPRHFDAAAIIAPLMPG